MRVLRPSVVAVVVAFWLLAGLAEIAALHFDPTLPATSLTWHAWIKRIAFAAFWSAVTLCALRWHAQHPLRSSHLPRHLSILALAALLIVALYVGWFGLVIVVISAFSTDWWQGVQRVLTVDLLYQYFKVWQVLLAVNAWLLWQRAAARERERQQLQLRLVEAELRVFRAQLEPHFLFNTLNSIAALVRLNRGPESIDALSHLAALLRAVLEVGQRQQMPWPWEREFTRRYATLQQLRFGERLRIRFEEHGIAAGSLFPVMLLQPLIENAIHHGPLDDGEPCAIDLRLEAESEGIRILVRNPVGRGGAHTGGGIGLASVAARLRACHGDAYRLRTEAKAGHFEVDILIPNPPAAVAA